MASWQEHFEAWNRIVKTDLRPIKENKGIEAGREAEDKLREIVNENYSFKGCHSFAAKRIPDPLNKRRREIDLIVVTAKKVYVIECKNWGGKLTVSIDNKHWKQTNSIGNVIRHEDVLSLNTFKMKLLVDYLRQRNIHVQPERVCQKLIFMNKSLVIDSSLIAKHPDVISPDRLDTYLGKENNKLKPHEQLFSSVIGLLLDEELKGKVLEGLEIDRVGGQNHDRLIEEIGKLATWDKIFLHGSKILTGDIIDRSVPNIFIYPKQAPFDWSKEIRVSFVKSKWWGLVKAFFRFGRPIALDLYSPQGKLLAKVNGNPHGIIEMQEAGSRDRTQVKICEIDRVVSGKYIAPPSKVINRRKRPRLLRNSIILGALIGAIPAIRNPVFSQLTNWSATAGTFWRSANSRSVITPTNYTGKYDFGRYSVKVYLQNNRLFAETATGKVELKKTTAKSGNEFQLVSQNQGNLGKYVFVKNQQGQIRSLVWIQPNGNHRKCPKV